MIGAIVNFMSLLLTSLLVGAMFGAWLMLQPGGREAATYVLLQQTAIRALNDVLPALGALALLATLFAALAAFQDRTRLIMLAAASVCLVAAGIITRVANQPINAVVMTWAASAPPAEWTTLRDQWWSWHVSRLALGLIAFALIIAPRCAGAEASR